MKYNTDKFKIIIYLIYGLLNELQIDKDDWFKVLESGDLKNFIELQLSEILDCNDVLKSNLIDLILFNIDELNNDEYNGEFWEIMSNIK